MLREVICWQSCILAARIEVYSLLVQEGGPWVQASYFVLSVCNVPPSLLVTTLSSNGIIVKLGLGMKADCKIGTTRSGSDPARH